MYKLFEDYINSPEVKIGRIFDELSTNVIDWFGTGALKDFQLEGGTEDDPKKAINISKTANTLEKTLMFKFTSFDFLYQVVFTLKLEDFFANKEEEQTKGSDELEEAKNDKICHVLLTKYDPDSFKRLLTVEDNVKLKDLTEDIILKLVSNVEKQKEPTDYADNVF